MEFLHNLSVILATSEVQDYFSQFGYVGIFIWFITVDQIVPVPEEITLLIIGYFSSTGYLNPILSGVAAIAAFMTVDTVYFQLTKHGNKFVKKLTKRAESPAAKKYKSQLRQHMLKTLMILCFVPRMRLLGPVFVALSKLDFKKFLVFDAIGLSLFTAVYIGLGFFFHNRLTPLISGVKNSQNIIFIVAIVVMIGLSFVFFRRKKKKK
jgi:membrane-associated protein